MKPVSIIFGLKSIFRRKQKNFFGILAITLGVSLITGISITNDSLSNGFGVLFTIPLGSVDGTVSSTKGFMNESLADSIGSELLQLHNVTAYTKELSLSVTTSTLGGKINLLSSLKGINNKDNTSEFGRVLNLDGNELNVINLGENETYVGQELAKNLEISKGSQFNFSLSYGPFTIERQLTVKDIVKYEERGSMNSNFVFFMDLKTVQQIISPTLNQVGFLFNNPVTIIYLKFTPDVKSVDDGNYLISQMTKQINSDTTLQQATTVNGASILIFSTDRISIKDYATTLATSLNMLMTIFGSILIIAGLILIVNIQLMTIDNKEKEIGIQRAVGTQARQIIYSNLTEFVIIGIAGGLVGIFGGEIFGWLMVQAFGVSFGFDGSLIPIVVPSSTYVTAFLVGFLVSIIAGLYPSIKASRIDVIEVLRGIQIKEFKIKTGSGIWGFIFGLILTLLGLLSVMGLSKNPLDFPKSYINVNDVEAIYISTTFLLVGVLVLVSYFVSQKTILTITGFSLLIYPLFQIFIVFNEIKEGSGGTNYLVIMMISLIGGSILLVALNLDTIATISEKFFSLFFSAVSMISFKQMSSQKTRSTLTFAIFAFILTLNIFLASWAFSYKYGAENTVNIMSGGSDILIMSAAPLSTQTSNQYLSSLKTEFSSITFGSAFPNSGMVDVYLTNNMNNNVDSTNKVKLNIFSMSTDSILNNSNIQFNFVSNPDKLNNTNFSFPAPYTSGLEEDQKTEPIQHYDDSNIAEDINTWKFLVSGLLVTNKTSGIALPTIITSPVSVVNPNTQQITQTLTTGDSIWLPLANGTLQEFVLLTTCLNNPLFDSAIYSQYTGTPTTAAGAFVSESWARQLTAFNPSPQLNLVDQSKYFLLVTSNKVKSVENDDLASKIQTFSNGLQAGSFRSQQGKSFGFFSTTVYTLYETMFDSMFRVLQFMQYFTTLGFLFGIVSLLEVSVRSVQERKRVIGLMRSIGDMRREVVISLILELTVMGTIGLLIGLLIGNILAYALVDINSSGLTVLLIPWDTISIYVILTLGSALIASIIPGTVASRIPPSEALRYTG